MHAVFAVLMNPDQWEKCFAIEIACGAVVAGICVVLFGRASRAGYVAPQLWRCEWTVRAGWQAVSRDLGRDALSADSSGLLEGSSAHGEGDGAEHDYDICVLERSRSA